MYSGYLVIETNNQHPTLVRIWETATLPPQPVPGRVGPRVRYAARFEDLSAARMHAHSALRRQLHDADDGLYRVDAITAIAAVDGSYLDHSRVYLDPALADDPSLAAAIKTRMERYQRVDRIWQIVGTIAVVFLLIKLLLGF